ncbi:MAG: DUF1801 domain-containing protein [Candidatus Paceibacterota bacterium]
MPKKIILKTGETKASAETFIKNLPDETLRKDCLSLLKLFKEVTGVKPKMWGETMVGFGEYTYHRNNGDVGTYLATGFSPRKNGPTIYIMPGYQNYSALLKNLGPHKLGKSCLYLKSLDGVDLNIIKKLVTLGLKDLAKTHQVTMKYMRCLQTYSPAEAGGF